MAKMTDKQSTPASFDIFDQDGQLITVLPEGVTVDYASDDQAVAVFEPSAENRLKGKVTSGVVGSTTIRGVASFPDGNTYVGTIAMEVVNSGPNSAQFTIGEPVEEVPPSA
jgi:hypothetical protein